MLCAPHVWRRYSVPLFPWFPTDNQWICFSPAATIACSDRRTQDYWSTGTGSKDWFRHSLSAFIDPNIGVCISNLILILQHRHPLGPLRWAKASLHLSHKHGQRAALGCHIKEIHWSFSAVPETLLSTGINPVRFKIFRNCLLSAVWARGVTFGDFFYSLTPIKW